MSPSLWIHLRQSLRALSLSTSWRAALLIWLLVLGIVATIVAFRPDTRTTTLEYRLAATKWWQGAEPIYRHKNGFLYLPQAAILYTPYNLLPARVGEPLWRATIIILLAASLWQAAKRFAPDHHEAVFLAATLLVLPSIFSNARNGQMNMALAGLYLFSALSLADGRWISASVLLALSLALKPISLVPILLTGVLYRPLRLPLVISLVILFGAAFVHPHPSYVLGQYALFFQTFLHAGSPSGNSWCDLAGLFRTFHVAVPELEMTTLRAVAALVVFFLAQAAIKPADQARSAFMVVLLAVIYLMLFNPRTETNSYVILGAFVATWGAVEFVQGNARVAGWLTGLAFVLGSENYGWPIFPLTNLWAKALVTAAFALWLGFKIRCERENRRSGFVPLSILPG